MQIARVSGAIDIKKLAKLYVPSLILINELHRHEVIQRLQGVERAADRAVVRLSNVLNVVERLE